MNADKKRSSVHEGHEAHEGHTEKDSNQFSSFVTFVFFVDKFFFVSHLRSSAFIRGSSSRFPVLLTLLQRLVREVDRLLFDLRQPIGTTTEVAVEQAVVVALFGEIGAG